MADTDRCRLRRPRPHPDPLGQWPGLPGGHGGRGRAGPRAATSRATVSCTASTTASASRCPSSGWPGPRPADHAEPVGRGHPPGRQTGRRAPDRAGPALGPRGAGRPPGRGPTAGAGHHLALDLVAPLADALGLRRRHRHPLRRVGRPLHRQARREASSGGSGKRAAVASWADDHGVDLGSLATPTATVSSTCRSSARWAIPTRSTPTPGWWRWPWPGGGRSSTGTAPRGSRRWSGWEPYHLARPVLPARGLPLRPVRRVAVSSTSPTGARSCWPPTTGATSTWWPSGWWRPGWAVRSASWPNRRCSTPRSWARWPGPSGASPSTGAAGSAEPDAPGRRRPAGRRGGHRPPAGNHPPGRGLLRPGAEGTYRHGPAGRRDRCPGRPDRAVGDRAGLAPLVEGAHR